VPESSPGGRDIIGETGRLPGDSADAALEAPIAYLTASQIISREKGFSRKLDRQSFSALNTTVADLFPDGATIGGHVQKFGNDISISRLLGQLWKKGEAQLWRRRKSGGALVNQLCNQVVNRRGRMKAVPKHVFVRVGNYGAAVDIVGRTHAIREAECARVVDQLREKRVDIDQF